MDSSPTDCAPSRFSPEGSHEPIINFVKGLTSKPVVGVGRFTSPDVMVSQVKRGILDLIGGARPSIADPFLPRKIDEGREHEIRECIGCNTSAYPAGTTAFLVRCTQNLDGRARNGGATGIRRSSRRPAADATVLIVGGGPAGLECAVTLARRGYSRSPWRMPAKEFRWAVALRDPSPGVGDLGSCIRLAYEPAAVNGPM